MTWRPVPNDPALFTEGYPERSYPSPEPTEDGFEPPLEKEFPELWSYPEEDDRIDFPERYR